MTEEKKEAPKPATAPAPAKPTTAGSSTAGVNTGAADVAKPAAAPTTAAKQVSDEEFEKALNEPDATPTPTDKELDAADGAGQGDALRALADEPVEEPTEVAPSRFSVSPLAADKDAVRAALNKIANLVLDTVSPTTPDSHVVWGYGGIIVHLGDLRAIARLHRRYAD